MLFSKSRGESSCKNSIKDTHIAYAVIMRVVVPRLECFTRQLFHISNGSFATRVSLRLSFLYHAIVFKAGTFARKTGQKTLLGITP